MVYHGNAVAVIKFEVWDGGVDVGHFCGGGALLRVDFWVEL